MPAYRIIKNDGTSYITSMAKGVTLEQAQVYFLGQVFTDEDDNGKETRWTCVGVEPVTE